MSHDVFVSHSSRDKATADAICHGLEAAGIRCWIAPRDILPGDDWGAAIIRAIGGAKVFVLVFSAESNDSEQVKREVERAVHRKLVIVPFRIEDVVPSESLEYFLSTPHWLDAFTTPLQQHIERLRRAIEILLGHGDRSATTPAGEPAEPAAPAFQEAPPDQWGAGKREGFWGWVMSFLRDRQ